MDGFGDDFVPLEKPTEDDPAAEFLAREQNELAGIDDDLAPNFPNTASSNAVPTPLTNGAYENEIFDAPSSDQETQKYDHFSELEKELHDPVLESEMDNGASPTPTPVREEPEKIRIWREEQEKRLMEKDAAEEDSKEELRHKAMKELEEWYKQHEEQVTKTRQANRSAEKELVADTTKMEPGTEWERIAKLCDFNPKTSKSSRDISRMRSIILQVKQNPPLKA